MNVISNIQFKISNFKYRLRMPRIFPILRVNLIGNWKLEIRNSPRGGAGFTLVELLIVIAIIGILSTVLMVNFVGIRERARDAKRKSDLRQMQAALELYRTDNGAYPIGSLNCGSPLEVGSKRYMTKIPSDPLTASCYTYTSGDGVTYTYYGCLENTNDSEKDGTTAAGCAASYTVQNP